MDSEDKSQQIILELFKQKKFEEVKKICQFAINDRSTNYLHYHILCLIEFINKNFNYALELNRIAIELNPNDSKLYENRGTIYKI